MPFQIHALDPAPFLPLFGLTDEDLARRRARRVTATSDPGFPCRISLADAAVGETLMLVNFQHLAAESPFAASHAIYLREGAVRALPAPGEVPKVMTSRLLSVRGFTGDAMMADASVTEGTALAAELERMLDDPQVRFVDIHYAKLGCFAALATRPA